MIPMNLRTQKSINICNLYDLCNRSDFQGLFLDGKTTLKRSKTDLKLAYHHSLVWFGIPLVPNIDQENNKIY